MLSRSPRALGASFALVAIARLHSGCSSSDSTPATDGGDAGALVPDGGTPSADASTSDSSSSGSDASAAVDPCALGAGANGSQLKTKTLFNPETPYGGTLVSGRYQLSSWGQKPVTSTSELEMQLVLQVGATNYWNASQFWGDSPTAHAGGGTFTVDAGTHKITFTKTCGDTAIDSQPVLPLTTGYTVMTTGELRLTNAYVHGASGEAVLIFSKPQ
jgi:hypothetical protein